MIPLSLLCTDEENTIKRIGGNVEVKRHLEEMGFVAGSSVSLISVIGGNIIVNVKGARIAISSEMAGKIFV